MAYWSSKGYDRFAYETGLHGPRNAKPRWQELAEIAQGYSSSSGPLPTATASTTIRHLEQMDHRHRSYNDGDDTSWDRRSRVRGSNVASLGASRSRSRSRPTRKRTIITEDFVPRRRSDSPQSHFSLGAFWKPALFILLLALLKNILVWYGDPMLPEVRTVRSSFTEEVWTSQDESVVVKVTDQICKIPVVPRVLNCRQPLGSDVPRNGSIQHPLRGIVSALSENPDTVDAILDLTEYIKKELLAIRRPETEVTPPTTPAEPVQVGTAQSKPLCIDHLLNLTTIFEANLVEWNNEKDELLGTMQAQLATLNLEHQDKARERFNLAVARNLGDIATSLKHMQSSSLTALNKTLGFLHNDMPITMQCSDAFIDEGTQTSSTGPDRPSVFKRLLLWSLPFTTAISPKTAHPQLTAAERKQVLHDKALAIRPLLACIHASNTKALSAATLAGTLMMVHNSWLGSVREVFWRGEQERIDEDIIRGLKEMKGLVPMIMEQRRGGRADRQYLRTMARAKKAVEEIKARREGASKTRRTPTKVWSTSTMRVWERRGGKMVEVHLQPEDSGEASEAHDKAVE